MPYYSFFVLTFQLSVRRKNAKEMFGGFFKNMVKTADEVILAGIKVGMLVFLHDVPIGVMHTSSFDFRLCVSHAGS